MPAYYNEVDDYAARWLENLIAAGHIAPGVVDRRDIRDVRAAELAGYGQCHFFAGIGGWSLALRLAGWPDDRPVWTGSCPCQPFSAAGAGKAADDERHLWPAWLPLISERRPAVVFGEQVEAAIGWGWLDAVFADLEAEGYACGATVLPACGVGAPHIRQRVWFVADADGRYTGAERQPAGGEQRQQPQDGGDGVVADAMHAGRPEGRPIAGDRSPAGRGFAGELGVAASGGRSWRRPQSEHVVARQPGQNGVGDATSEQAGRARQPWQDGVWIPCTDGKARPVEPGTFPLAHGIPGRVGRLRAYGNAIVPQAAAEFIRAAGGGR